MKKLAAVIVFFFLFLVNSPKAFAQTPTPIGNQESTTIPATDDQSNSFTLDPPLTQIDDFTPTVTVQFNNPDIPKNAFICLDQDMCIDSESIRQGIIDGKQDSIDKAMRGLKKDDVDEQAIEQYKLVNGKIVVCGNGDAKLKSSKEAQSDTPVYKKTSPCDKNNDYFHAGSTYVLSVYEKTSNDIYILRAVAGFYVNHGGPNKPPFLPPKVEIVSSPIANSSQQNHKIKVTVATNEFRVGGDKRNTYQVSLVGPGVSEPSFQFLAGTAISGIRKLGNGAACFALTKSNNSQEITFPTDNTFLSGSYTVNIKESNENCTSGFTYFRANCTISSVANKSKCSDPIKDPGKVDLNSLYTLFALLGDKGPGNNLPCKQGKNVDSPLDCPEIDTAIGSIKVDVTGFIARLFSIVLSIAGVAAISLIVYSGYRLLISRGNKEMIQGARETLTAAIVGLLFIVFSLVILSVIGGDILKIPGFGN